MGNNFNNNGNKKNLDGVNSISFTTYRTNYSNDEGRKENNGVPLVGGGEYTLFEPILDSSFRLLVKGDYTNINLGDEGTFEEVYYITDSSVMGASATVTKLTNLGYLCKTDACDEVCGLELNDRGLSANEIWFASYDTMEMQMYNKNVVKITL